jgi:hypothetical protein
MESTRSIAAVAAGVAGIFAIVSAQMLPPPANAAHGRQPRQFYLTTGTHAGGQVLTACAAGFHMASLWEILDPTGLRYDTTLGVTAADSGSAAPTAVRGWIRTGTAASGFPPAPRANCHAWTSSEPGDSGTLVQLTPAWAFDGLSASPWFAVDAVCSAAERVWCVSD